MKVSNAIRSLALLIGSSALGSCLSTPKELERDSLPRAMLKMSTPPEWGWRCFGRFEIEGRRMTIWRDFDASGKVASYFIQTFDGRDGHATYWTIDPRLGGPTGDKLMSWDTGRSEEEVLRNGPDYVHIDYPWHTEVVGPVHVYFWGDGKYIGAEQLFTARQVRHLTGRDGKMGGLSGGLSKGPIMQALYRSQNWTFKVTDATGKELTTGTFRPPDLARSVSEYRRARAEIESLEAEFRADFQLKTRGTATCVANDDPTASI